MLAVFKRDDEIYLRRMPERAHHHEWWALGCNELGLTDLLESSEIYRACCPQEIAQEGIGLTFRKHWCAGLGLRLHRAGKMAMKNRAPLRARPRSPINHTTA
jgi:hypothetical protein